MDHISYGHFEGHIPNPIFGLLQESIVGCIFKDRFELALATGAVQGELTVFFLLDKSTVDKLWHQVSGNLASLIFLLELEHLLLKLLNLSKFGLGICLFLCLCLLLSFDLRLGSSALAGHLKHICRNTFGDYKNSRVKDRSQVGKTYVRRGCLRRTSVP